MERKRWHEIGKPEATIWALAIELNFVAASGR